MSSKKPCRRSMIVVTCCDKYEVSIAQSVGSAVASYYLIGTASKEWNGGMFGCALPKHFSRPCRPGCAAPFGDDGVRVRACVRVILRLYADRVAEEGCRRGLRDVSELVWEDALVRTTLVTCRFCYSKPPLTLARVYQSVGPTTRHRLRHDLFFIPGLNEHLQTLKKVVTRH